MPAAFAMLPESRRRIDFASADGLDDTEGSVASARNRNELLVALVARSSRERSDEHLAAADAALMLLDWISSTGRPESAIDELRPDGLRAVAAAVIRPGSLRVALAGSAVSLLVAERRRGLHLVASGPSIGGADPFRHRSVTTSFGRGVTAVLLTGDTGCAVPGSCRPTGRQTSWDLLRALQHELPASGAVAVVRRP